jgi:GT2 family glycosyltransferase
LKVDVISGACILISRKVFEQVGLYSEDYFMYAEDIDLNYEVKRAGFSNYYIGTTSIIHHGGKSSSLQPANHWSTVMKYRAMNQLFCKMGGPLYGLGYRTAIGCSAIARLGMLMAAKLTGDRIVDRKRLAQIVGKWQMILSWSVGAKQVDR